MSGLTAATGALARRLIARPILAQKGRLAAIAGALATLALAQGVFLLMVNRFFKALFTTEARAAVPLAELVPAAVLDRFPDLAGATVPTATLVYVVPATILGAGLLWALATYVFQLNQQGLSLFVAKTYRDELFAALVQRPYMEIRRRSPGEWMSIVMNDVMFLQMRLSDLLTGLVRDTVVILSAFVVLALMHWPTAVVIILVAPFVALGMGRTGKRIARYSDAFQRELTRLAGMVLDLRARFDMIRSQAGEERERRRFGEASERYYRMIRRSILVRSAFAPALEAFGFVLFAACVYAIGNGLWQGFTPELMMQFLLALGVLLKPLKELGEQLTRLGETRGVLNESLAIFARHPASVRHPDPERSEAPLRVRMTSISLAAGFDGQLKFRGQSLVIAPGKAVAIVGPSGAGKSTLVKALVGLIEPAEWRADVEHATWTQSVSMVSQEPFLFDDTVRANLIYGFTAGSEPNDAAIRAALATVNVTAEVDAMPQGLDSRLRAIGANVSGGQQQRLVIARALLREKPVLILDEATSAIDARTEEDLTKRLIAACHADGTALVAVTHRLTWLGLYDEVWFVEGGARQLVGKHAELLREPRYAAYCAAVGGDGGDDGR